MKLGVISLGCDKATVDSERLVGELVGHGATVVPDPARADVVLVNTCGFIDAAKRESIEAILEAAALKKGGSVKAVVAVGCLVQRYRQELAAEMPEVDLLLGFSDLHRLVPELAARGLIADPVAGHPGVRQYLGTAPHVRYLKISEGCDHGCAFCAIPLMRGRHRSEPVERLVREARVDAGGAEKEQPRDPASPGRIDDVRLDQKVLEDELGRVGVVGVDAADLGGGKVDVLGPLFGKEGAHGALVGEVELLPGAKKQVAAARRIQSPHQGSPDHPLVAGDEYFCILFH